MFYSSYILGSTTFYALIARPKSRLPLSSSSSQTEIAALHAELTLTRLDLNLIASPGEKSVSFGGVYFESRGQIISWVRSHLPSGAYNFFHDVVVHLDALGSAHLLI